jgi:hypothetical protein
MLDITNSHFLIRDLNFDMNRKSMDKRKNNFVNVLLVFCKCNNMFICNGRVDQDKGHGQLTSKSQKSPPRNYLWLATMEYEYQKITY